MLKKIPTELLRPGSRLPGALRDKDGKVIMPAGAELTEASIGSLGRWLLAGVYGGDDWPDESAPSAESSNRPQNRQPVVSGQKPDAASEPSGGPVETEFGGISVDVLRLGMRLAHNIFDDKGVLLLAAGSLITARFLQLLQQRNIKIVRLRQAEEPTQAAPSTNDQTKQIDAQISAELATPPTEIKPSGPRNRPQLSVDELWAEGRRGLERHVAASASLKGICESVQRKEAVSADKFRGLMSDFVDTLTLDCDLLTTILSMQQSLGEYLFDHCINVALVSMSMADYLGLGREQTLNIGMGAVFQDVGMLKVPADLRLATRSLTPEERTEIERHPIYTLEYLEKIQGLPKEVGFIGYQTHERIDGSGYPRRRSGMTTHPLAKIVAIADTYCAMVRPRPYRPALRPHEAVKQLLAAGAQGKLDRELLRAFLDVMSVFPIGSCVELSRGPTGMVIRANPGAHTRPVVVKIGTDNQPTRFPVDLSTITHTKVVRALECPGDNFQVPSEKP